MSNYVPRRRLDIFSPVAKRQGARDEHVADNMMPGFSGAAAMATEGFSEVPDFRPEQEVRQDDTTIQAPFLEGGAAD